MTAAPVQTPEPTPERHSCAAIAWLDEVAPEEAVACGGAKMGRLAELLGAAEITVNSLHGQAIDRLAPGLAVEAVAPDGTIEAVRVKAATGFAYGVQWHPEWQWAADAASTALFRAFGAACRRGRDAGRRAA